MKILFKKILLVVLICTILLGFCCSCSTNEQNYYSSINDLADKRISVWQGFTHADYMINSYPNAEYYYFGDINLMYEALNTNKIDAFGYEECFNSFAKNMNLDITYLKDCNYATQYGTIHSSTQQGQKLLNEFNSFIDEYKASGKLSLLQQQWLFSGETKPCKGINTWDTSNGEINVVTCASQVPFHYLYDGEVSGYETALLFEFCKAMGYKLNITIAQWDSMLAEVKSGRCDMGYACIELSEEHQKSFDMSNSIFDGNFVIYVKANPGLEPKYTLADLEGKTAACLVGSIDPDIVAATFKSYRIENYQTLSEASMAVISNKADYCLSQLSAIEDMMRTIDNISYINEPIWEQQIGAIFNKNNDFSQQLLREFNEFINSLKDSGELEEITAKWIADPLAAKLPERKFSGKTVNIAISPYEIPYAFIKDGEYHGIELDLLNYFCEKYNYTPHYDALDFGAIVAAVTSSKYDFAVANICITEERAKSVDFSVPYANVPLYVVVSTKGNTSEPFFTKIKNSFNRTFIEENRYEMFIEGIITTLIITVSAAIIGTASGFVFYMLCRKGNRFLNKFLDIFARIMIGLPMVVILMILYYIIFGKSDLSGTSVAIIGFSLSIALAVYSDLKVSVLSIDSGQIEGAYAIGFTDKQTFFRIILPQALQSFLPMYKGNIIGLINGTAIVGFIAVQDLTKMSDLIRARTYEAFFPLIATAIIYLVLGFILTTIVKNIQFKFEPERRSKEKILKIYGK